MSKNLFKKFGLKKKEKLNYLEEMRDYYSQKIKEKTGICLGEIKIQFLNDFFKDMVYDRAIEELKSIDKKDISLKRKI